MRISMKMRKTIPTTLALFWILGLFLPACETGNNGEYQFSDWDQDGNEQLDENEFYRAYAGVKYHNQWDANQDKYIDEEEWGSGVTNYWVAYDIGEYGAFSSWDPDVHGKLSEEQFQKRIFEFYDKDRDGALSKQEYQAWYNDFNE
jgi:hypothetical protein